MQLNQSKTVKSPLPRGAWWNTAIWPSKTGPTLSKSEPIADLHSAILQ